MTWTNKKVLITGAGGFIGSHLAERLVQLGAKVRAMVHYNALGSWGWLDQSEFSKDMEIFTGNVRDMDSAVLAVKDVEIVFHLAALIGIPYSYLSPEAYVKTNISGTLNLLQSSRGVGVERFIHTSTSEVYGTAMKVPIDESHPQQGQSPYSASKIGADKMVEAFVRSFDFPAVTVRPFNTFGPRQSERAIVPTIISQVICGNSVKLGSLEPRRDLNFVSNTVDGFILAAQRSGIEGEAINLGTGSDVSIGELAEMIVRISGKDVAIETDDKRIRPRQSEVMRLQADISKAGKILGWEPKIELAEGLGITIDWMKENLEKYRPGQYSV